MGLTLRGPIPRRGFLFSKMVARAFPSALRDDFEGLFADEEKVRKLPMSGVRQRAMRGEIIGKFEVTTATNVSRTAQDPAFWAPLMGSWQEIARLAFLCAVGSA